MTKDGPSEDFENSESEIKRPAGNESGGERTQKGTSSFSLARRGSGPQTAQGKERSKHNATKHGIFSKVVVLKGESRAEFDALLSGLWGYFEPVGMFEKDLVEMLAVTRWHQRRLLIAEGAEIEAGRKFLEWDETQRQLAEAGRISQELRHCGLTRKIANPEALRTCLDLLGKLKERIEQNDFDLENEKLLRVLYVGFGDKDLEENLFDSQEDNRWEKTLFDSYQSLSETLEPGESSKREEWKRNFLQEIAEEIARLERYKNERTLIEAKRIKLEVLRRNVPDSPRLDQLLRYSASKERTFERTLSQLERAQRRRLGQPVPPPINLNISSS